nr:MAG TPA: hypothetical protein [Caudoviricetes sp.]
MGLQFPMDAGRHPRRVAGTLNLISIPDVWAVGVD